MVKISNFDKIGLCSFLSDLGRRHMPRRKVGLALGVFDFCHHGHLNFLRRAAANCDRLVVAVHTDEAVLRYKKEHPANSETERARAIAELGIADVVEIESDRKAVCRRHRVTHVFHGDDWSRENYENHWGRELIAELGVEIAILPHTPGVSSTGLRSKMPRLGWWLYSPLASWDRSHIFDHLRDLHAELGGTWFVSESGRGTVREVFHDAPVALIDEGVQHADAARAALDYGVDVIVTAHFNFEKMLAGLRKAERPIQLVVLSHGRSGKPGASAGGHLKRKESSRRSDGFITDPEGALIYRDGPVTVHDFSYATGSYVHLDRFLASGGSFVNPVPESGRPRLLLLSTWGVDPERGGMLLSRRWRRPLKRLGRDWDLFLSPHPLSDPRLVRSYAREIGCEILPARGRSFELVPGFNATLCDLSGVFWEAMLFDTPAVLAEPAAGLEWPLGLPPSLEDLGRVVSLANPERVVEIVSALAGERRPRQRELAESRLGRIDGCATARMAERIRGLLWQDAAAGRRTDSVVR